MGLLVAAAVRRGFTCRARYLNLTFSTILGCEPYEAVAVERSWEALGEHLFAVDLFGPEDLASDEFLNEFVINPPNGVTGDLSLDGDALIALRDGIIPDFLEECAEDLLASEPDVIGFSCVFNQVMPSLALARRIKEARPEVITLLGGGSVHGAMGVSYARAFRGSLDHVFTGEADLVFPAFLEALRDGRDAAALPGVTVRGELAAPPLPVAALDDLPLPNYDDYFAARSALKASGGRLTRHRDLPYESARGCWWGEKSHCTFCGLNNEGMVSRMKSTDRVLAELTELAHRYRSTVLAAADNILTHTGYRDLLPRIAELGLDFWLFYEIKANVSRDDVAALRQAGILWIQPGIESFSDHVLTLMRKGVSTAQNIQLLKWLQEFGITPYYNVLVGFPGETDEDFDQMLRVMPSLFHLTPPVGGIVQMVQVHRFSPFFYEPDRLGIQGIRPEPYYRHLIPPSVAEPSSYAYFFDRDIPPDAPVFRYRERMNALLGRWTGSRRRLSAALGPGFITIRSGGRSEREVATLEGEAALVFLLADAQTSVDRIGRALEEVIPGASRNVDEVVSSLVQLGVLVEVGRRVVGVVPFERPRRHAELAAWSRRWLGLDLCPEPSRGPAAVAASS